MCGYGDVKNDLQQHFYPDKRKQNGQTVFQKTEHIDNIAQQKEQRPQSDNRKDIGKEDNIRILRDGENGGDGIHRKKHIGKFNDKQKQKQGRKKAFAVNLRYKFVAHIIGRNGETAANKFYQFMLIYIYFFLLVSIEKQFDSAINKNCPENGEYPLKSVNKCRKRENKNKPHGNRPDNPPKQNAVIIPFIRPETEKKHQNHKNIVNGKSILNGVSRDKLQRKLVAVELQIGLEIG